MCYWVEVQVKLSTVDVTTPCSAWNLVDALPLDKKFNLFLDIVQVMVLML